MNGLLTYVDAGVVSIRRVTFGSSMRCSDGPTRGTSSPIPACGVFATSAVVVSLGSAPADHLSQRLAQLLVLPVIDGTVDEGRRAAFEARSQRGQQLVGAFDAMAPHAEA